jgi:hypothetical protein
MRPRIGQKNRLRARRPPVGFEILGPRSRKGGSLWRKWEPSQRQEAAPNPSPSYGDQGFQSVFLPRRVYKPSVPPAAESTSVKLGIPVVIRQDQDDLRVRRGVDARDWAIGRHPLPPRPRLYRENDRYIACLYGSEQIAAHRPQRPSPQQEIARIAVDRARIGDLNGSVSAGTYFICA